MLYAFFCVYHGTSGTCVFLFLILDAKIPKFTFAMFEKQSVHIHPSNTVFKFGDGHKVFSHEQHRIPAFIGKKKLFIETSVVDGKIPLLLSKASMRKAGLKLDFCHDTVTMLGENVKLSFTESGHYCISISNKKQLISQRGKDQVKVVLHVSDLSCKSTEEKRN